MKDHGYIDELVAQTGLLEGKVVSAEAEPPRLSEEAQQVWDVLWDYLINDQPISPKEQAKIETMLVSTTAAERAVSMDGTSINNLITDTHVCLIGKLEALNQAAEENEAYDAGLKGP